MDKWPKVAIIVMVMLFAKGILQVWLGTDFARESTIILQILVVGVLINSLAYVPSTLLSGTERPDIPAKIHLLELPFYAGTVWVLINQWRLAGAAGAWVLRVVLDAILLFGAAFRTYRFPSSLFAVNGTVLVAIALLVFASLAYGLKIFLNPFSLSIQVLALTSFGGLFAGFSWKKVIDASDRRTIFKAVTVWRRW